MARIRSVKPEFFTSESVAELTFRQRLLWIGLWTHVDDSGRCRDNARLIQVAIWPLDDVSIDDVEDDLAALAEQARIERYTVDGRRYIQVTNWSEHQHPNRPTPSKYPAPSEGSPTPTGGRSEHSRKPESGPDGALTESSVSPKGPRGAESASSQVNPLTESAVSAPCGVRDDSSQEGRGEEGRGVEARETRSTTRRSPETPLPNDWAPNDNHRTYALANNLDLDHEAEQFRNHVEANDRRQRNWDAAFRTWLGKAYPRPRHLRMANSGRATGSVDFSSDPAPWQID